MLGRLKLVVWVAAWLWAALVIFTIGFETLAVAWGFYFVALGPLAVLLLLRWIIGDTFKET